MAKTPRKRIAKKYLIELDKENTLNNNNRISNLKENIQNAEKKLLEIKNNQEIATRIVRNLFPRNLGYELYEFDGSDFDRLDYDK